MKKTIAILIIIIMGLSIFFIGKNYIHRKNIAGKKFRIELCQTAINIHNGTYWSLVNKGIIPEGLDYFWIASICYDAGMNAFDNEEFSKTMMIRAEDICPVREKLGYPKIGLCI